MRLNDLNPSPSPFELLVAEFICCEIDDATFIRRAIELVPIERRRVLCHNSTREELLDPYVRAALTAGARIAQRSDKMWVILDEPEGSPLWYALFQTRENAARAYCKLKGIEP